MSDNIKITLLPSGVGDKYTDNGTCVSFNVKSDNIKVFPSSWRGVNFIRDGQGKIIPENAVVQFNPEATLNTEYNLTHSAGGIKTYIETLDEIDTTNHIFDLDFFLNGYHFEIFSLNLKYIYSSNLNLWACIRVDDLSIGDAELDDTKVLMPYYWNALNTPIPLDATLQDAYLIDETAGKGFDDILSELQYKNGNDNIVTEDMSTHCIFTGLVLTTVNPEADNSANIYTIQLFRNGQACYDNFYPRQVRSGRPDGKSTVIGDEGLIASRYANMLAVGAFNAEYELANGEKPLFVVGNGTDDAQRRNAFEVFGKTENGEFSQTVKFGNITFKHDSDVIGNVSDMSGLRNINGGIQVTDDGRSFTVNQNCVSNTDIGIHSYGNIDLRGPDNLAGSKLRFQDYDATNPSIIKTISDFQIVEVATGKSNVIDPDARGLKMTNIHEINEKALVFKPCNAGIDRNKLRSINDGSIGIDDDTQSRYQHSIEIGRNKQDESAALTLAGDNLVIKSVPNDGEYINNIRIKEKGTSNTDNLFNIAGIYNKNSTAAPAIYFDDDKIEITPADLGHDNGTKNSLGANLRKILLDAIYPIGSIYMSMENRNPSQTLGGKWERISEGRMLLGAGTNGDFTGEAYDTGGFYESTTAAHEHTGSINITTAETTTDGVPSWNNATLDTSEHSIKHTHTIKATAESVHKHSIPVSLLSNHADEVAARRRLTHPDAFASYEATVADGCEDHYLEWTNNYRTTWQKRYRHMFEDKGHTMIPTVSMGTWWPGWECMDWNAPSPVYTGYQYVTTKQWDDTNEEYLQVPVDSFLDWRDKCDTDFKNWFTCNKSYNHREEAAQASTYRFCFNHQNTESENNNNDLSSDYFYLDSEGKTEYKGPAYSSWYNDWTCINRKWVLARRTKPTDAALKALLNDIKAGKGGFSGTNTGDKEFPTRNTLFTYDSKTKTYTQKAEAYDTLKYWFMDTTTVTTEGNLVKEFLVFWYDFFRLNIVDSQQDALYLSTPDNSFILGHLRWSFFRTGDLDIAWTRFKNMCTLTFKNGSTTVQNNIAGNNENQAAGLLPSTQADADAWGINYDYLVGYSIFRKPDSMKDAFIRNWIANQARNSTTTKNHGDAFKFRKDDGEHKHDVESTSIPHSHTVSLIDINHIHRIPSLTVKGDVTISAGGETDTTMTNLPPYLVCYIWKRTN